MSSIRTDIADLSLVAEAATSLRGPASASLLRTLLLTSP
jgi:hypothetical protein